VQVLDNTALNRIATQQLRTETPSVQVGAICGYPKFPGTPIAAGAGAIRLLE